MSPEYYNVDKSYHITSYVGKTVFKTGASPSVTNLFPLANFLAILDKL